MTKGMASEREITATGGIKQTEQKENKGGSSNKRKQQNKNHDLGHDHDLVLDHDQRELGLASQARAHHRAVAIGRVAADEDVAGCAGCF